MRMKRSSNHQRCSIKKSVVKNFKKLTGKHLCQREYLFFKKNFIKKKTLAQVYRKKTNKQVFSCELCEIFKNTVFTEHLWTTASENGYVFSWSVFKPSTVLKLLEQYGFPITCATKTIFLCLHGAQTKINIPD